MANGPNIFQMLLVNISEVQGMFNNTIVGRFVCNTSFSPKGQFVYVTTGDDGAARDFIRVLDHYVELELYASLLITLTPT